jgi:hypothetical protein
MMQTNTTWSACYAVALCVDVVFSSQSDTDLVCAQISVVHVETIVGQQPGHTYADGLSESTWLNSLPIPIPYRIVAYAHLARDDTESVLRAQAR